MQHYKLVIFDWDGTLMDSIGRIVSSMQAAAIDCLLEHPTNDEVKNIIGLSLPVALEVLFPSGSKQQLDRMLKHYKYQYVHVNNTPTPLFDGALTLLKALTQKKILLAVATGKARQGLQRAFEMTGTEHYFHASRCADEANSKPDPQMILSLLEELNVLPEHAVMIGDTSHDMAMAQAAGIDRIGITLGVHDKKFLDIYKPKAVVNSLSELQQLLTS
jgi:phosphoglycolate phosphatase